MNTETDRSDDQNTTFGEERKGERPTSMPMERQIAMALLLSVPTMLYPALKYVPGANEAIHNMFWIPHTLWQVILYVVIAMVLVGFCLRAIWRDPWMIVTGKRYYLYVSIMSVCLLFAAMSAYTYIEYIYQKERALDAIEDAKWEES